MNFFTGYSVVLKRYCYNDVPFRRLQTQADLLIRKIALSNVHSTQPAITCSKLRKETLEQGVKYVQS